MTQFCLSLLEHVRPQQVLAASAGVPLQEVTDQARSEAKSIVADFSEEQKK